MSNSFVFNNRRDANDVIRGFYYQIELTVLRWLELDGNDFLYCECGEDIDHIKVPVNQTLDFALSEERILEQIKDINASISLNTQEALVLLCRFYESAIQNPNINIRFRFSTTTLPAKEQNVVFPGKKKGILLWEDIRNDIVDGQQASEFVNVLKKIISEAERPNKISEELFNRFRNYMASSDNQVIIDEFVKRFEWAIGLPDPPKLETQMQEILIKREYVSNIMEATQLINDLKLYVLELLIKDGEKKLTINDLELCINDKSIIQIDRRRLTRIENFIENVNSEIHNLRNRFAQFAQQFSNVVGTHLSFQLPTPHEPPISPEGYIKRRELVNELQELLLNKTWLHITGGSGMGKTYLAKLLAESLNVSRFEWVSLAGELESESLSRELERHLLRIANSPYIPNLINQYLSGELTHSELIKLSANRIGKGNLLVIDEVPDLTQKKYKQLSERLEQLSLMFQPLDVKIITTAQRDLPPSILNRINNVFIAKVPPLSREDIIELSTVLSAPPSFLSKSSYINSIYYATEGHPQLVYAAILYIRNNSWVMNEETLLSIFEGQADIKEETQRKVRNLLGSDKDLRELLYRLSLVRSSFDKGFVSAVAKVPKEISLAGELFNELIGPWINKLTPNRFGVSPLLKNTGKEILDWETQRDVHCAIARQYGQKGTITQHEASQAIYHWIAASDWPNLTYFVFGISLQVQERFHAEEFELVGHCFEEQWVPEMPIQLRILFRAAQIRIRGFLGKENQQFIDELDKMIDQVSGQMDNQLISSTVFLAHSSVVMGDPSVRPIVAAQKTLKMLRLAGILSLANKPAIAAGVWMGERNIKTHDDIWNTIRVLAEMTEQERKAAFSESLLQHAPRIFADKCWMLELDKPDQERDWEKALSTINQLEEIAQLPGAESFITFVARAKAIILSQHPSRLQEAIGTLIAALPNADSNGNFLLNYTAGYILLVLVEPNQPQEALDWLQKALAESVTGRTYSILQYEVFLYAVEAAGRVEQWSLVRELVLKGLRLSIEGSLIYQQLQLLGELAWAYWSLGDNKKAWASLSGLINKLTEKKNFNDALFCEVYGKTLYLLDWLGQTSQSGNPPTVTTNGEPFIAPFGGLFARSRSGFGEILLSELSPAPLYRLGQFGVFCGLYDLACRKFNEARQLAQSQGLLDLNKSVDVALMQVPQKAAQRKNYQEALSAALSSVRFIGGVSHHFGKQLEANLSCHKADNIWENLPKEDRHDAEFSIYWSTIGVGITNILVTGFNSDVYLKTFTDLEMAFRDNEKKLADIQYWLNALMKLKRVFDPFATLKLLEAERLNVPEKEYTLPFFISLGVPLMPDATLRDSFLSQTRGLKGLYTVNAIAKVMLDNMAAHIFNYWIAVAEKQAFALSNPKEFKRNLAQFDKYSISNAAKLLLMVSDTIGVRLEGKFRHDISNIGNSNL